MAGRLRKPIERPGSYGVKVVSTLLIAGLASCVPAPDQGAGDREGAYFAPRIPVEYFHTGGTGTSWEGIPPSPYETFSYDVALLNAGIEDFNVVPYTSVLPKEVYENRVELEKVKPFFHPGSVLEVIMAQIGDQVYAKDDPPGKDSGRRTKRTLATGVGIVWAAKPSTPGVLRNGYAAEYEFSHEKPVSDEEAEQQATAQLNKSLDHELSIRGLVELEGSERRYQIDVLQLGYKSDTVQYGYCLSALGFVKFQFPPPYPPPAGEGS